MTARLILPLVLLLNACVPASQPGIVTRGQIAESALPPMKRFAAAAQQHRPQGNATLAADFLDLTFQLENGRALPVLTRFEGPVSLRVTGTPPASLAPDLQSLLARLRNEAGIDITLTQGPDAGITIAAVSRREINSLLPDAACFVAPNVGSLAEYRRARRTPQTSWANLQRRERLAIFLPHDASPQELRDCLHEELAQALGPLNDLYRLSGSVFNDDNVHNVLTGFDMLILRITYDPALRSGMSREEVAAALPALLARINPGTDAASAAPVTRTPRVWIAAIQTALGRNVAPAARRVAAEDALRIARHQGWQDHRRGFSHYAMGRVLQRDDPAAAQRHYRTADGFYARQPGTALHRAHVATQLAAHAVIDGDGARALAEIAPHIATAQRHENAALLATLLLLRAEALELEQRAEEAAAVRLDSIGWARYGFGPDWAVRAKLREIASLNPRKG
ncbi:DUF2927 domain-containing protein [Sulfitobacter aestuarii]|uniref:DUF2927 domain-containing protein n=1 Tax=Sulfitobacter aestuarii TaxID=2161676 RepID=A0ABW5U2L7_9RHOB